MRKLFIRSLISKLFDFDFATFWEKKNHIRMTNENLNSCLQLNAILIYFDKNRDFQ